MTEGERTNPKRTREWGVAGQEEQREEKEKKSKKEERRERCGRAGAEAGAKEWRARR
jgi:hypothetical protein